MAPTVTHLEIVRWVDVPSGGRLRMLMSSQSDSAGTLVLLHGMVVNSATCWCNTIRSLPSEFSHYNMIAFDCYGHGSRSPDKPARVTLERYAEDVLYVLNSMKIETAVILGQSLGGAIGQIIALKAQESGATSIRGLILSSTAARFRSMPFDYAYFLWFDTIRSTIRLLPRRAQDALGSLFSRIVGLQQYPYFDDSAFDWPAILDMTHDLARFDSRDWIKDLNLPCASIITTKGDVVSVDKQRELAELVQSTDFETHLGHDGCMTDPVTYAHVLAEAISATV